MDLNIDSNVQQRSWGLQIASIRGYVVLLLMALCSPVHADIANDEPAVLYGKKIPAHNFFENRNLSQSSLLPQRRGVPRDLLMPAVKAQRVVPKPQVVKHNKTPEESSSAKSPKEDAAENITAENNSKSRAEVIKQFAGSDREEVADVVRRSQKIREAIFGKSAVEKLPAINADKAADKKVESTRF